MRAGNPNAIRDAKQQAVKKMAVRPVSRDEVCAHEEDEQLEDRLDIRTNHEYRRDARGQSEKRQAEDQFPVHVISLLAVRPTGCSRDSAASR